jgi:C-terminal processing protease CtpA/Prc
MKRLIRREYLNGVRNKVIPGLILVLLVIAGSCNKDNEVVPSNVPEDIRSVNNFIFQNMDTYYLWRDYMPSDLNPDTEPDPSAFFDKFIYKAEDKWSYITDDYQSLVNHFSGINYTFGHNFKLFHDGDSERVFGVVEYVVKDTPADLAGLERGVVFNTVNGIQLTVDNYLSLLFGKDAYTLGLAEIVDGVVTATGEEVSLVATQFQEDPVFLDTVYHLSGKNIGYFVYNQFIADFDQELHDLFADFKSQNVTDLIIDLRYNPGGAISTARLLASLAAPADPVNNEAVFAKYIWNDILEQYWLDEQGADSRNLMIKLLPTANNLNLDKIYFLVTNSSASASETLINGLMPYMDVVLIGETTSGKYTGSLTLHDEAKSFNWAIQPIVVKTANADGNTEFRDGFAPDYLVKDDLFSPLGSVEEGMLAEALGLITGIPVDQLARKAYPEILEGSIPLLSGGRVPISQRQVLWIDNLSIK